MKKRQIIRLLLCGLWMAVIFYFSAQPGNESGELSDHFVALLELIFMKQEFLLAHASFIIRKGAHMCEYAILAILFYRLFQETKVHEKARIIALYSSIGYAMSDELHQLFVVGRAGLMQDVLIDGIGALIGLCIWWLLEQRFVRKSRNA